MKPIYLFLLMGLFCPNLEAQSIFAPCTDGTQPTCRCNSAPVLCSIDELDGAILQMAGYQHPNDAPNPLCPGTSGVPNNPSWMAFTAWCENLELEFVLSNCTQRRYNFSWSNGVQVAAYSACGPPNNGYRNIGCLVDSDMYCCSGFNCRPPNNLRMNLQNLSIGAIYYLMVDGCGGARCDVRINVVGECGREQIQAWPSPVNGPDTVCVGLDTVSYSIVVPQPNLNYHWTVNGVGVKSDSLPGLKLVFPQIGNYEVCVDASKPPCIDVLESPSPNCKTIQVVSVSPENPQPIKACAGDSIFYEGRYYLPGSYSVNLLSRHGCDSTVVLTVEEIKTVEVNLGIVELCGDTTFRVGNEIFDKSGVYTVVLSTQESPFCDSLIQFQIKKRDIPYVDNDVINCDRRFISPAVLLPDLSDDPIFTWLDPSGIVVDAGISVSFNNGGLFRLQVAYANSNCVLFSNFFEIKVDTAAPVLIIESPFGDTITCQRPFLPLSLKVDDAVKYFWEFDNRIYSDESVVVNKSGLVRVVGKDTLNGCIDSTFLLVFENRELPTMSVEGGVEVLCGADQICRKAEIQGSDENYYIRWENNIGELLGEDVDTFCFNTAGEYRVIVQDRRNGCITAENFQILDNRIYPEIVFPSETILDCKSDSLVVPVLVSNAGDSLYFVWLSADGTKKEGLFGDPLWASMPGWYSITVTNMENGCSETDSIFIKEDIELPDIENWISFDAQCDGSQGSIRYRGQESLLDFRYFLQRNEVSISQLENLQSGLYFFSVMGSNGCKVDTFIEIKQPGLWVLELDTFAMIELGDSLRFNPITDLSEGQRLRVIWEPGQYIGCDSCLVTQAYPVRNEIFRVILVDTFGCSKFAEIKVRVKSDVDIFIPDAFSPNGDGINDLFSIYSRSGIVTHFDMKVYDRWGAQVFEGSNLRPDAQDGWNGKWADKKLDQGVYLYQVRVVLISQEVLMFSGEIHLLHTSG